MAGGGEAIGAGNAGLPMLAARRAASTRQAFSLKQGFAD
jgi:hypothetical protein